MSLSPSSGLIGTGVKIKVGMGCHMKIIDICVELLFLGIAELNTGTLNVCLNALIGVIVRWYQRKINRK